MSLLDLTTTNERTIIDFGKWRIHEIAVIGHYRYNHVHPQLPRHQHPNMMEIVFCAKGEQTYEVNGQLYSIKGGDIFITMPNELHSSAGYPEDKGKLYWIIINPFNEEFLNLSGEEATAFKKSLLEIPNRHFPGSSQMKKCLETMIQYREFDLLNLMQQIKIKHLMQAFLLDLIEIGNKQTATIKNEAISNIIAYIEQHLDSKFSIAQLASMVYLSESRFKAWFKKETGIPPLEFVLRKKINYAKELLKNKNKSISDIALELDFSSAQHFSKVFKKFIGVNPRHIKQD